MTEKFPYEDIVNLEPHVSKKHPRPTIMDRAARFAPFAAITGYEEMVLEEARETTRKINLDEGELERLNEKLNIIKENINEEPIVKIIYFKPDDRKSGGKYESVTSTIVKIDEHKQCIYMFDGTCINMENVFEIESEILKDFYY